MLGPVKRKSTRSYDSSRRQQQALENRRAVLEAARERFLRDGYAATTLNDVAADAGVSVQTIYKTFANKAGLLKGLFDVTVAGDDEPVPMVERDVIQDVVNEPDPTRKIGLYIEHLARVMPRTAPIELLARDAAAADAGAAEVWATMRKEMLMAMTQFAANLAGTGRLRVGPAEARDVLWTYHSAELYELLVLERRWSAARYGRFLSAALVAALVEPA
jgi:AcrR family transcriptional regulator